MNPIDRQIRHMRKVWNVWRFTRSLNTARRCEARLSVLRRKLSAEKGNLGSQLEQSSGCAIGTVPFSAGKIG